MAERNPEEAGRAAADMTRGALDAASETSRNVFSAWAAGTDATLKATFDAQNAALDASIAMLQTTSGTSREALDKWTELARKAQQAALEAFRANVQATEKAAEPDRGRSKS